MKTSAPLSNEQVAARAARFKQFWEVEGFDAFFQEMRGQYLDELAATKPNETSIREQIYWAVQSVDRVQSHIVQAIADGSLAEAKIRRK